MEKRGLTHVIDDSDFCVFHLGSGPKFVKHAFERCLGNAFGFNPAKGGRSKRYDGKLGIDETTTLFNNKVSRPDDRRPPPPRSRVARCLTAADALSSARHCIAPPRLTPNGHGHTIVQVAPSLRLATRIGPQHTAATYTNITSLCVHEVRAARLLASGPMCMRPAPDRLACCHQRQHQLASGLASGLARLRWRCLCMLTLRRVHAPFVGLCDGVCAQGPKGLKGKTVNVFSYGSGAAATMFRLKVASTRPGAMRSRGCDGMEGGHGLRRDGWRARGTRAAGMGGSGDVGGGRSPVHVALAMASSQVKRLPGVVQDIHAVLDKRNFVDAGQFDKIMDEYAETYARFDLTARVRNGPQPGGAYYLRDIDKFGRRAYYQVGTCSRVAWR